MFFQAGRGGLEPNSGFTGLAQVFGDGVFLVRYADPIRKRRRALELKGLTIVQDNRPGLLAEVTTLLESKGINISSIGGETVEAVAALHLIATPYQDCLKVLSDAGFKVFTNEQIIIRLRDEPGALASVSRQLANDQVDIRSIHFVDRAEDVCVFALVTGNDFRARQLLREVLVS